jgi:hypothetical protein
METVHINNLISLVAMTVDRIHRRDTEAYNKMCEHMMNNPALYGEISRNVEGHIRAVVSAIESNLYIKK